MLKRIIIILFAAAILVTGYLSFKKLRYWDRSVMIFRYDSSQPFSRGRGGTGFGEFDGRERGVRPQFSERPQGREYMNIPDSIRQRMNAGVQRNFNRMRPWNDSLNIAGTERSNGFQGRGGFPVRPGGDSLNFFRQERTHDFQGRGGFPVRPGGREGNRDGGFRGRNSVNLRMVLFYLSVFAMFTVVTVYLEKGWRLLFKQKKLTRENTDLII